MAINNVIIPEPSTPKLKWRKTWWGKTVLAIIILLIVAIAIFSFRVANFVTQIKNQNSSFIISDETLTKLMEPGNYIIDYNGKPAIGSKDAKIKIVEFFDFNCVYCKAAYPIMRTISSQYKDDVQIIMHNYPFINASSNDLALAGECANEQGLFWNIHDRFFQSSAPAENILAIARQSGLNMQQFASCMENEKYADKIQEEKSLAETIVPGTPTWIINGHLIPYASEETFKQIIDALVKNL